jgi:hypothetical protein
MATLSGIITPSNVLTESSTATLTNKTINAANNTVTNVPLSTGVTGTLPVANGGTGLTALGTAGQALVVNSGATALEYVPLPASAGTIQAIASGTLSSGQTVVLKTDGTVEAVSGTSGSQAVYTQYSLGSNNYVYAVVFSPDANKVVIVYGNSSNYPTAVVGTISGTAISFGTPRVIDSYASFYTDAVYDTNSDRVIVTIGRDDFPRVGIAYAGTISGTGISFGSGFAFKSSTGNALSACRCVFDESTNRTIVVYVDPGETNNLIARALSCSGSTITAATPETTVKSSECVGVDISYNSDQGSCLIAYTVSGNTNQFYRAMTTGGSSFTFGAEVSGTTISTSNQVVATNYDQMAQKHLVVFRNSVSPNYAYLIPVSLSGTTVTVGTHSNGVSTAAVTNRGSITSYYDAIAGKSTVVQLTNTTTKIYPVDLTGSSPVVGTTATLSGANLGSYTAAVFVPTENRAVIAQRNSSDGVVYANLYQNDYVDSNFADFLGITNAAILDTATGSVTITYGISTNVTGLTPNSLYYVQADGTLSTTVSSVLAGRALSSTTLLLQG